LLHKHDIDLSKMKDMEFDNMMGEASGAGDIYGVSGGVLEAAMRNAKEDIKGEVKAIFVAGLGEARKICEELVKDPFKYDAVEVMACEGGCIGGGGQSVPTSKAIRAKRAAGLRKIDERKTVKRPKDNPIVKEIYETLLKDEETIKKYCHRN
jgi:iron only hydrogenase large subunit-like protein